MTAPPLSPNCPKCGKTIDAAIPVDQGEGARVLPVAGDVAICDNCGHVSKFDGPVPLLRSLTPEEQAEVMRDSKVMSTLIAMALANRKTLQ